MDIHASKEGDSVSRFWDRYIDSLHKQGIKPPVDRWYVRRSEQYITAFPDKKLVTYTLGDVSAYFTNLGRNTSLKEWQFAQVVDAIQNFFKLGRVGTFFVPTRNVEINTLHFSCLFRVGNPKDGLPTLPNIPHLCGGVTSPLFPAPAFHTDVCKHLLPVLMLGGSPAAPVRHGAALVFDRPFRWWRGGGRSPVG